MRTNSSSAMSAVVAFLALHGVMTSRALERASTWRRAAVYGITLAGMCCLRNNYVLVASAIMAASYGYVLYDRFVRDPAGESGEVVREAALVAGFTLLFWLPWMILSYRSSGTPLYPITEGYHPLGSLMVLHMTKLQRLKQLWEAVFVECPFKGLPFFALAGVLVADPSRRKALRALWFGVVVSLVTLSTIYSINLWDVSRYSFGILMAAFLVTAGATFRAPSWKPSQPEWALPSAAVIAGLVIQIYELRALTGTMYSTFLTQIEANYELPATPAPADAAYRELQTSIPAGEPLWTLTDEPYRFDFGRNRIHIGDFPGHASPPPGMPLKDPERMATYFRSLGIRYLAFVNPARSANLYNRDKWHANLLRTGSNHQLMAPFFLDTFASLEALAASRKLFFDAHDMIGVDLDVPKTSASR
jgi:hypothetical protein